MMIEQMVEAFPDGIELRQELMDNQACMRVVLAWLQAGEVVEDAAQWLVDVCAYQELPRECELDVLCAGYAQLYKALLAKVKEEPKAQAQLLTTLKTYAKLHMAHIVGDLQTHAEYRGLPAIRNVAEAFWMGAGHTEMQLFFRAIIDEVMPTEWMPRMAEAQSSMWLEASAEAAELVGELWQLLFDMLLPREMQTGYFCLNCLRGTYYALVAQRPKDNVIWRDITDSFINTLETE